MDDALRFSTDLHQAVAAQYGQVPGKSRLAQIRQRIGFADRALGFDRQAQDRRPLFVGRGRYPQR